MIRAQPSYQAVESISLGLTVSKTDTFLMKAFIIGASGYVGSAIDDSLRARGYETSGTVRSDEARHRLAGRGTEPFKADVCIPQSLAEGCRAADVVIYAARITQPDPWMYDGRALRAIAQALAGTEKTFIYTSNAWVYGSTAGVADEDAPVTPPRRFAQRPELERQVISMTKFGIRSIVVRPGVVFGSGGGVPTMFAQSARERGAASIVGDGGNSWATIHREDLGELFAVLVDRGRPGRIYNATSEHAFLVRSMAEAASRGAGAGGATTIVDPRLLGEFGQCLALDQMITSQRAQNLGWMPTGPTIIDELEHGSYQRVLLAS